MDLSPYRGNHANCRWTGGLWNLFNLLTRKKITNVITRIKLFFLTEEQKGHKLCSFVLLSKVICLHVSRVSARNFYLSTWLHGLHCFSSWYLWYVERRRLSFLRNYLFMSRENRNFAGGNWTGNDERLTGNGERGTENGERLKVTVHRYSPAWFVKR